MAWPPFRRSVRTAHGADFRINWPSPCKARSREGEPRSLWRRNSLRKRLRFARNSGHHRNARLMGGSCLSDRGSFAGLCSHLLVAILRESSLGSHLIRARLPVRNFVNILIQITHFYLLKLRPLFCRTKHLILHDLKPPGP